MDVMPSGMQATVELYLDGKIREWYSRGDGKGAIFLVEAKTEDEARAIMETLPLAKENLMDYEYIPGRTADAAEGIGASRSAAVTLLAIALPQEGNS